MACWYQHRNWTYRFIGNCQVCIVWCRINQRWQHQYKNSTQDYHPVKIFHAFSILELHIPKKRTSQSRTTLQGKFLLVLMKLCLNVFIEDLADWFNMAKSTVTHIFYTWIDVMAICLMFFIKWPMQDIVQANVPQIFGKHTRKARCIIDCSEVLMEQPLSFNSHAQTCYQTRYAFDK